MNCPGMMTSFWRCLSEFSPTRPSWSLYVVTDAGTLGYAMSPAAISASLVLSSSTGRVTTGLTLAMLCPVSSAGDQDTLRVQQLATDVLGGDVDLVAGLHGTVRGDLRGETRNHVVGAVGDVDRGRRERLGAVDSGVAPHRRESGPTVQEPFVRLPDCPTRSIGSP